MKNQICEFETSIVREFAQAKDAGFQNEKLALHLKECADCREALKIAGWMQKFSAAASSSAPQRALPTAGFILWKSKILEKQQAGKRAAQPIVWAQQATVFLTAMIIIWLAIQHQSEFKAVIKIFSASLELIALPFLIAFICGSFICLVLAFKWRKT